MWIFAIQIGIWSAAFVGIAAIAAFGQSSPVLTGAAAYGDWRSDARAPGIALALPLLPAAAHHRNPERRGQWLFAACQCARASCGFEIAGSMISPCLPVLAVNSMT